MYRTGSCVLAIAVLLGATVRPVAAQRRPVLPHEDLEAERGAGIDADAVRQAIEDGVKYLKSEQARRGNWSEAIGLPGGISSLCTLALLNAGEKPDEPHVKAALDYLSKLRLDKTYTVALQTMVFCAANPQEYRLLIHRNVRWLEDQQIKTGDKSGAWSYPHAQAGGDPSNTQFALLALHEAERVGVEVNRKVWERSAEYWLGLQSENGAWRYRPESRDTGSMTCAGIASMVIASGRLGAGDARVIGNTVECCGNGPAEETREVRAIRMGMDWMSNNFTVRSNPGSQFWHLYYLYGLERVGRMTAQRLIGGHDWYREGAEYLVKARGRGRLVQYWKGEGHAEDSTLIATSLALLFLAKGKRPVMISKLEHKPGTDWNRYRSDVDHLTRFVERRWQRDLTWQVIDPAGATVDDLLTAPVLYISGREGLELAKAQQETLKKYIEAGGFIFADQACEGKGFDRDFKALVAAIVPGSQLRPLGPEHPVYFAEEPVDLNAGFDLLGVDSCCRTSIVYCPRNLACHWELARQRDLEKYPAEVRKKIEAALVTGANVVAYASGRELKDKLDPSLKVAHTEQEQKLDRGKLYVAKLDHNGGSNAAPNALPNLLRSARENLKMRASDEQRLVSLTDKQLYQYPLAFMHGRERFTLSPDERAALRKYVERGGFVMADAICANGEFAESFRREMKATFPEQPLQRIATDDAMFTKKFGGDDITTVERREPQFRQGTDPLKANTRKVAPLLEGIQIGDRYGVVFSPYDLSCALENRESLECVGYVRRDAARIGINLILYALHQ